VLLLDVIIRYPAITLLLLVAIFALRDGWKDQTSRFAAYLSISVAAILLGTAPPELQLPPIPFVIARFLDHMSIGFVWWLGLSMFDDDFKLGKLHWAGMLGIVVPIVLFRLSEFGLIERPSNWLQHWISIFSLILMCHLICSTLIGRKDDMVESRRKVRLYFVIGLAIAGGATVVAEILFHDTHPAAVHTFRGASALPMALWGLLWLTKYHPEKLSFQKPNHKKSNEPTIDPRDQELHGKLISLMHDDKAFMEPGLTIRSLAEKLNTPEHQLRALINKGMGHRNFSGFLNQYRIDAVIDAMKQPQNARIPVLTLAMDVGFNSLAPFNRAFRNITGKTPTEYRAKIVNKNNDETD